MNGNYELEFKTHDYDHHIDPRSMIVLKWSILFLIHTFQNERIESIPDSEKIGMTGEGSFKFDTVNELYEYYIYSSTVLVGGVL
jgi:hypothetical protein